MCGGIGFNFRSIPEEKMKKYFSPTEIARFKSSGQAQSFFWTKRPALPIEEDGKVDLLDWGNRDDKIELPKTGWAKAESVEGGKWAYLHPEFVKIPAEKGYEKGHWFDVKGGLKGLVIKKDHRKRAYMLTKPADKDYLKLTKHDRQPVEFEK